MLDRITLITGNADKAAEFAVMLGIEVTALKADLAEIQDLDVGQVAARKAADAFAQVMYEVRLADGNPAVPTLFGPNGVVRATTRQGL